MQIRPEVLSQQDFLVNTRRDLHRNPELGFEEVRTGALVAENLRNWGVQVQTGVAKTGVVGVIQGAEDGPTVLLRADMDALPIQEETDLDFASQTDGKMHACGHDGHTAILLTTARVLAQRKDRLKGRIKLVFQPAEEGPGGAKPMIDEGVLRDPKVDAAFGLHLWSPLPVGKMSVAAGPVMAAADRFAVKILGKGGHAAAPHETIDPILVAAHVITALHSVVSRNVNPFDSAVVSVTKINAGTADNIIPAEVDLGGTIRTFHDELRTRVRFRVQELVERICAGFGAHGRFQFVEGYPPLVNDPELTALVADVGRSTLGLEEGPLPDQRTMGGEDMAYYLRHVPGCFFFLGAGNPEPGCNYAHHHPRFNIDERALPLGVEMLLRVVERYTRSTL